MDSNELSYLIDCLFLSSLMQTSIILVPERDYFGICAGSCCWKRFIALLVTLFCLLWGQEIERPNELQISDGICRSESARHERRSIRIRLVQRPARTLLVENASVVYFHGSPSISPLLVHRCLLRRTIGVLMLRKARLCDDGVASFSCCTARFV